jgi:hypothetical protein
MAIIDIGLTNDGDLYLNTDSITLENDIALSVNEEAMKQQIVIRIKTYMGDWLTYPQLGASLADFIGLQNTRENAELIASKIKEVLTYDKFISSSSIEVYSIPVNQDEILFTLRVVYGKNTLTFPIAYSLKEGIQEGGTSNW